MAEPGSALATGPTAPDGRFEALLCAFAACADDAARGAFILAHPVIVHDRFIEVFRKTDPRLRAHYFQALQVVNAQVDPPGSDNPSVEFDVTRWPVGAGPLEAIWSQLESFEISPALALQQARSPAIGDVLTLLYVQALSLHTDRLLRAGQADRALGRQRLVVAAAQALEGRPALTDEPDTWRARYVAMHAWLQIGSRVLATVADPRLLREALADGERLLAQAQARDDLLVQERIAQRLGMLYLDTYTAGRDLSDRHNYEFSLAQWQQRLADHLGHEFQGLAQTDRVMPPVREALAAGERFLREAMALRPGLPRGENIAALLQLIKTRELLGEPVDEDEMVALAREALALLPPDTELERRIRVSGLLRRLLAARRDSGVSPDAAPPEADDDIERLMQMSPETLLDRFGQRVLTDAVRQALAQLLFERRHEIGLQMIDRFAQLLLDPALADEEQRMTLWDRELRLFQGWLHDTSTVAAGQSDTRGRFAELLGVARAAMPGNREAQCVQALAEAVELDGDLSRTRGAALINLRARLELGEGTNRFNARDLQVAAYWYAVAIEDFARLELPAQIWDCLARLYDIVDAGLPIAMAEVVARLELLLGAVPALARKPATRRLQEIFRRASGYWRTSAGETAVELGTIFRTMRLAKGYWFAGALLSPVHYDWREDDDARRQLSAIAALAAELDAPPQGSDGEIAEDLLIDAAGLHEQRAGSDTEQRYENLRLAFDDDLRQRLAERVRGARPAPSSPSATPVAITDLVAFQASIETGSVVLDYFSGIDAAGRPALHVLAIARDGCVLCGAPLPQEDGTQPVDGAAADAIAPDALGSLVRSLRVGIAALPGFARDVSRQGAAALARAQALLVDPVRPFLEAQREKGARQLLVVPHGPLHFLPLHLLGGPDAPLAQSWRVAYLPAASLLARGAGVPPGAAQAGDAVPACTAGIEMTAVGLDFREPARAGVPPIDGAPAFVRELAAAMGGVELVNAEATRASVSAALQASRRVHVYTHGQQCAYAAAFHGLYLAPDSPGGDDGMLCAYELLPLHCQGLEVLTLSACESALGRFDAGDNLVGLPGSLLLAGVQRLVGTLWPVAAPAAETFFRCFYAELARSPDLAAAFEHAQQAARAGHPEYRDWGAFYFIGRPWAPASQAGAGRAAVPVTALRRP